MRANIDVEHTAVVAVTPARICASERTKSEVGVGVDTKTRLCRGRRRRRLGGGRDEGWTSERAHKRVIEWECIVCITSGMD